MDIGTFERLMMYLRCAPRRRDLLRSRRDMPPRQSAPSGALGEMRYIRALLTLARKKVVLLFFFEILQKIHEQVLRLDQPAPAFQAGSVLGIAEGRKALLDSLAFG